MAQNHQAENPLYKALEKKYIADIASANATMIIYFDNPVAIGEHPQHLIELDKLLEQLSTAEEKLINLNISTTHRYNINEILYFGIAVSWQAIGSWCQSRW
jgi:hypothetical protein